MSSMLAPQRPLTLDELDPIMAAACMLKRKEHFDYALEIIIYQEVASELQRIPLNEIAFVEGRCLWNVPS